MRSLGCVILFLYFSHSLNAQTPDLIPPEKPKLVIGLVIEQMRYDYILRYWDKFQETGFKRLINEGSFCKNAYYNYIFTQSSPGYASIATGTYPSSHGIIADSWYLRLKDQVVGSVDDKSIETVGGSYESGQYSPKNLLSTTIGDELKLFNNAKSKVLSIALNPSSAILASGHSADASYWFDDITGNWISSTYYMDTLPGWVDEFNSKRITDTYLERIWTPILPLEEYTESTPDTSDYENGIKGRNTFPYELKTLNYKRRKKKDYAIIKYTPYGLSLTKDFALSLIVNENLGKDEYTDILMIGFSSTGYIGSQFGLNAVETEDAYLRLDMELSHFLSFIDFQVGKGNVLIYLTADNGVAHIPDYLKTLKIPAGEFNKDQAVSLLISYLNIIYGKGNWVKAYNNQQLYLDRQLIEDSKIPLHHIQEKSANFLIQFTGVANAISATTLEQTDFTEGVFTQFQNSFHQKRSGDVLLNLEPGWIEKGKYSTFQNSGYRYDIHVPLIWYGWKIKRVAIYEPVEIIDIAPTLSNILDISYPNSCTGNPVFQIIE